MPRLSRRLYALLAVVIGVAFALPLLWALSSSLRGGSEIFQHISRLSWETLIPSSPTVANYTAPRLRRLRRGDRQLPHRRARHRGGRPADLGRRRVRPVRAALQGAGRAVRDRRAELPHPVRRHRDPARHALPRPRPHQHLRRAHPAGARPRPGHLPAAAVLPRHPRRPRRGRPHRRARVVGGCSPASTCRSRGPPW
ncbi:hypothetical protein [Nonomuraea salmonea]|uniref:hypothetical protein n=1 Tax=Nonomuraea salmonea TaxID=46181 RepID=UPI0031F19AC0